MYYRSLLLSLSSSLDGILYIDLNVASFDLGRDPLNCFPQELCEKFNLLKYTVVYNDPIHAIVLWWVIR